MEGYNNIIMIIFGKNGQKMGSLLTKNDRKLQKLHEQEKPMLNKFRVYSKDSQKMLKTSSMGKSRVLVLKDIKKQKLCLKTNQNMNQTKLCLFEQKKTMGSIRTIKTQDFYTEDSFSKDLKQLSLEIAKQAGEYFRSNDRVNKSQSLQELIHWKMKSRFPKTMQSFDRLKTISKFDDLKHSFEQFNQYPHSKKKFKKYRIQKQFDLTLKSEKYFGKNNRMNFNFLSDYDQNSPLKPSLGIQTDMTNQSIDEISKENVVIKQLQRKIKDFSQKLQDKQEQLSSLQKKLKQTKEANLFYLDQMASHRQYLNYIQQQKSKIACFLQTQPNKILQMEVQGYKQCEQQLFNLAHNLENSNYEGMLNSIYQEIDVPQSSFYYMIDNYQLNGNSSEAFGVFKEKLKSVYHRIKTLVQSILKLKGKKIETFVTTLRKLASYTIGKRQYLEGIKKKVIYVSGEIKMAMKMLELKLKKTLSDEPFKQLLIISDGFHNFREAFREAQVFY